MEEKIYKFYTLSSEENLENIRYVGVTINKLNERLSKHKHTGKNPKKRSTPVAKWIYSLQLKNVNVVITKIDECNEDCWEEKEKQLILKYKFLGFELLNIDVGGKGVISIEQRNVDGLQRSADAHKIRIVQLDLNKNYIATFESLKDATEKFGLGTKSAISNVLRRRSKTSGGFYWVYENDYLNNNYNLVAPISPKETKGITLYQYCPKTFKLLKIFMSLSDVYYEFLGSRRTNTNALKKAIDNKETWRDFFWSYFEILDFSNYHENYKVLEINLKGIL